MTNIKVLLLLFASALIAISCSDDNTTDPPEPSPETIYKIGVLIPLSGAGSLDGKQSQAAVEYAIADINQYFSLSGIKVKIQAYYKDSGTDSTQAQAMLREFADDSIKIVVGPYSSTVLQGLKHIADSAGILLISHASISTTLAIENDNIFRFVPTGKWQAKAIAKMMLADNKKVVIPLVRNDVWGNALYDEVYDALESSPLSLQSPEFYPPSQTNFSSIMQRIKSKIEDLQNTFTDEQIAVYMITYGEGTEIMRQCSYLDVIKNIKFYGSNAFAWNSALLRNDLAVATAVSTKLECPIMGFNENYSSRYTPLIEKITNRIAHEPDSYALSIYDAAYAAGYTLSLTGDTVDVDKIKSKLRAVLGTYNGMNGKVELDKNDDRINVIYDFMSVKNDDDVYKWIKTAVYDTKTDVLTRK
jgi:ABC-type branched-subunit amino acid transport system substrate-binding protein